MATRPDPPAAVLAIGCVCSVLAAAAGAQTLQPGPLYDRYTEPIQIFKDWSRHL